MTDPPAGSLGASGIAREQDDFRALVRKKLAMASPMPIEAPVITTTFPEIVVVALHLACVHSDPCHDNKCFFAISVTYSASFADKSF